MVNIGALAAEIDSRVWANFNRFRVLALIVTAATSLNGSQRNFARPTTFAVSWTGTLYTGTLAP